MQALIETKRRHIELSTPAGCCEIFESPRRKRPTAHRRTYDGHYRSRAAVSFLNQVSRAAFANECRAGITKSEEEEEGESDCPLCLACLHVRAGALSRRASMTRTLSNRPTARRSVAPAAQYTWSPHGRQRFPIAAQNIVSIPGGANYSSAPKSLRARRPTVHVAVHGGRHKRIPRSTRSFRMNAAGIQPSIYGELDGLVSGSLRFPQNP